MSSSIITENKSVKKILVVDDDNQMLRGLTLLLEEIANVVAVSSGDNAIEMMKIHSFDVILTDYSMVNGNGLDVLKFAHDHQINSPVIMITSMGTKELIIRTMQYQIFSFLEKPFGFPELKDLVKEAFIEKEQRDYSGKILALKEKTETILKEMVPPLSSLNEKVEEFKDQIKKTGDENVLESAQTIADSTKKVKDIIHSIEQKSSKKDK